MTGIDANTGIAKCKTQSNSANALARPSTIRTTLLTHLAVGNLFNVTHCHLNGWLVKHDTSVATLG